MTSHWSCCGNSNRNADVCTANPPPRVAAGGNGATFAPLVRSFDFELNVAIINTLIFFLIAVVLVYFIIFYFLFFGVVDSTIIFSIITYFSCFLEFL